MTRHHQQITRHHAEARRGDEMRSASADRRGYSATRYVPVRNVCSVEDGLVPNWFQARSGAYVFPINAIKPSTVNRPSNKRTPHSALS
ncbi:hypothetical protein DPMN_170290 [Dreissena polymorpha]|uniref:Uncharacterized protein n=1 Tax=Dreissena polymorpha TaxID=45954 RepID=A0A9D4DX13_DREPO|nr:hypothetical protein DPMN_170290 [Dreissena polymorpha]